MNRRDKAAAKKQDVLSDEEQLQRLGARIRQLRLKLGYTNYEHFAYEHNISRAQFGCYEQGQDLRFSTLVKIVSAFGMNMKELFSEGFE